MAYLFQFCVILIVCFIGEILHALIPLPIPASIYGLVIMFILLSFKIIKLEKIEKTADFLIQIMPIMFVPPAVGIITVWADLKNILIPFIIIVTLSTVLVMALTGKATELVIKRDRRKQSERDNS
jgi:holin-like protein